MSQDVTTMEATSQDDHERTKHMGLVVDHVLDSRREWVESDTPYITESVETAVNDMIDVFRLGSIPHRCREMNERVENLAIYWDRWQALAQASGDRNVLPGNNFWKALENLQQLRNKQKAPERKELEPIHGPHGLLANDVGLRQICLIYGWEDHDGNAELWKLQQEIDKPGTWVDDNFVPPLERERIAEEIRNRQIVERIESLRKEKLRNLTEPAKEPWADLLSQKLSARQLSRMKRVTIDEVMEEADQLGVPRPPVDYEDVRNFRAPAEPKIPEVVHTTMAAEQARPTRGMIDTADRPAVIADDTLDLGPTLEMGETLELGETRVATADDETAFFALCF